LLVSHGLPYSPHTSPLNPASELHFLVQVAAEALRVCEQMVSVIRPNPPAPAAAELSSVVSGMFSCINGRLAAQDQDQEVKECAILCMAHLVATCGDMMSAEVGRSNFCLSHEVLQLAGLNEATMPLHSVHMLHRHSSERVAHVETCCLLRCGMSRVFSSQPWQWLQVLHLAGTAIEQQ
jgi:hypothetical protein